MNILQLQRVLLSPLFLIGLGLLLLNDLYFKEAYGNFITGKLSDVAGLFIFPLFFSALIPKKRVFVYLSTAVAFILWKSPYSDAMIAIINSTDFFKVGRTVDYSDLATLVVLPVSFLYFDFVARSQEIGTLMQRKRVFLVLFASMFAFTATTLTKDRHLALDEAYLVRENHQQIESKLKTNQAISMIRVRRDDEVFDTNKYPDVEVDRRTYFFDFLIDTKTCDSAATATSFVAIEKEGYSELRGVRVKSCGIEVLHPCWRRLLSTFFKAGY